MNTQRASKKILLDFLPLASYQMAIHNYSRHFITMSYKFFFHLHNFYISTVKSKETIQLRWHTVLAALIIVFASCKAVGFPFHSIVLAWPA